MAMDLLTNHFQVLSDSRLKVKQLHKNNKVSMKIKLKILVSLFENVSRFFF